MSNVAIPTSITLSPEDLEEVKEAARLEGKTVSAYLRELAVPHARRTVRRHKHRCPTCGSTVAA